MSSDLSAQATRALLGGCGEAMTLAAFHRIPFYVPHAAPGRTLAQGLQLNAVQAVLVRFDIRLTPNLLSHPFPVA